MELRRVDTTQWASVWQASITRADGTEVTTVEEAQQALNAIHGAIVPTPKRHMPMGWLVWIPDEDGDPFPSHEYSNAEYTVYVPGM